MVKCFIPFSAGNEIFIIFAETELLEIMVLVVRFRMKPPTSIIMGKCYGAKTTTTTVLLKV